MCADGFDGFDGKQKYIPSMVSKFLQVLLVFSNVTGIAGWFRWL